jgi:PAS domain S-box-containing protein
MTHDPNIPAGDPELRRRAEERLRTETPTQPSGDPFRIMHELQVHQIEMEMQNEELREARNRLEDLVERYTDLYDFAPVAYFSLDETGRIQQANLPGAAMLGVERSKLRQRRFASFVEHRYLAILEDFLRKVFGDAGKQVAELAIETTAQETVWVDLQATKTISPADGKPLCRLAVSDVTARKRAAEAQLRVEALEAMNIALENEISRRRTVEKSLRQSRQIQTLLLKESKRMEEELRLLSHQILHTQEEERKRISQNLHDEIAQTLVAINVHLATLARRATSNPSAIAGEIVETQKMVERSVESVHRFAMGLRPTQLDDLGLIPALQGYINEFQTRTKIPILLTVARDLKPLGDMRSVALYRIAQAALTNVANHAEASRIKINVRQTQRSLSMTIHDDGKSFDALKALSSTKIKRLGLIGMRERVEMVGGKFKIASSPGKGTTIRVTVPLIKPTPPGTPSP